MDAAAQFPGIPNQVIINQQLYTYRINPFVLTNTLGFVRAILREYQVTGPGGEIYKLYKITEHNWYDADNANPAADNALLRLLKLEIDYQEKANV